MIDRTFDVVRQIPVWIAQHFALLAPMQEMFCLVIAGFILLNLVLYFCTRGKEFAIVGFSAVLFLLPFVRFD